MLLTKTTIRVFLTGAKFLHNCQEWRKRRSICAARASGKNRNFVTANQKYPMAKYCATGYGSIVLRLRLGTSHLKSHSLPAAACGNNHYCNKIPVKIKLYGDFTNSVFFLQLQRVSTLKKLFSSFSYLFLQNFNNILSSISG